MQYEALDVCDICEEPITGQGVMSEYDHDGDHLFCSQQCADNWLEDQSVLADRLQDEYEEASNGLT